MPLPTQLKPTFGIEIECILLSVDDDCPLMAVHNSLSRSTKAQCASCGNSFDYKLSLHPVDGTVEQESKYSRWTVGEDASLRLSNEEKNLLGRDPSDMRLDEPSWSPLGDEFPIEIKSRVLSWEFDDTGPITAEHVHRITAQDEVRIVYQLLNEDFVQDENAAHRMLVNPTCSTHVHIGNGTHGFPLQTLKNLVSTVVACERPLDILHSTHRIGGRNTEDYVDPQPYNFPWSADLASVTEFMLEGELPKEFYPASVRNKTPELKNAVEQSHVSAWLEVIKHAKTIKHLQDLQLDHGHYSTVNLENLVDATRQTSCASQINATRTIEFRQHAGTLSAEKVLAWVEVLIKMIQFADNHSEQYVSELCQDQWAAYDHDILDLLRTIGVSCKVQNYYRTQLRRCRINVKDNSERRLEDYVPPNQSRRSRATAVLAWARDGAEQDSAPQSIKQRIKDKFLTGCYGQFSRQYLKQMKDHVDMTDLEQEKLTIGWRPEPVFINEHTWNSSPESTASADQASPICERAMDDFAVEMLDGLLSDLQFHPHAALVEVA